jgi:transcriptional regulator with XRE-family HTH domain
MPAMPTMPPQEPISAFGRVLRHWRARRRLSQLDLATEAGISSRHLSFIETGRAEPSREMVVLLGSVLDVPLRDRNDLLVAAGYAPMYRETDLQAPGMAQVRRALDFILRQQEPYPAIALDRHWGVVQANQATVRLVERFTLAAGELGPPNAMRLIFHPHGFRPFIVNWEATAAALVQWLHRDLLSGLGDDGTRQLLDELLGYPGVPRGWRSVDLGVSSAPFLAIEFSRDGVGLRFFSMLTTLGTPTDVTLQELRVESFYPADEATEETARRLAAE